MGNQSFGASQSDCPLEETTTIEEISMSQPIVIAIAAPYVTAEKYAEISGMKLGTVEKENQRRKDPPNA